MSKALVLVIEDDKYVRNLLQTALEMHGYQCRTAENGMISIQEALSHQPQMILLDLGLPDMDGMDVLMKIRSWSQVPIIVVSAREDASDKVKAFDAGADDYVVKPFSIDELMARLRAHLRREGQSHGQEQGHVFRNGPLQMDFAAGTVQVGEQDLHLTPLEYKLLALFAKNVGKVLTHQYIFHEVWGRSPSEDMSHLRVFMLGLRKKMESVDAAAAALLQTHVGVGYRMVQAGNG